MFRLPKKNFHLVTLFLLENKEILSWISIPFSVCFSSKELRVINKNRELVLTWGMLARDRFYKMELLPVSSAGIFKQSMGARNRVGIGLSYRLARLHVLAELINWNRCLGSIKVKKFGLCFFTEVDTLDNLFSHNWYVPSWLRPPNFQPCLVALSI